MLAESIVRSTIEHVTSSAIEELEARLKQEEHPSALAPATLTLYL